LSSVQKLAEFKIMVKAAQMDSFEQVPQAVLERTVFLFISLLFLFTLLFLNVFLSYVFQRFQTYFIVFLLFFFMPCLSYLFNCVRIHFTFSYPLESCCLLFCFVLYLLHVMSFLTFLIVFLCVLLSFHVVSHSDQCFV
jgi:hypothetical protein